MAKAYIAGESALVEKVAAELAAAGHAAAASPAEADCAVFAASSAEDAVRGAAEVSRGRGIPALAVFPGAATLSAVRLARAAGVKVAPLSGTTAALAGLLAAAPAPEDAASAAPGEAAAAGRAVGESEPENRRAAASRARIAMEPLPNAVCFFSPAGGVGKTFLAANAASWAARLGARPLLVDADPGYGDAAEALFLGEELRRRTWPTAASWRGEEETLRAPWGLSVLPRAPLFGPAPGAEDAAALLRLAAERFGLVAVDAGSSLGHPFVRALALGCRRMWLVADGTDKSLAKLAAFLEGEARILGLSARLGLAVNRAGTPGARYRPKDVARALGFSSWLEIPWDPGAALAAARRRVPVALLGKGAACAALRRLAEEVLREAGIPVGAAPEGRGLRLPFRSGRRGE